MTLSPSSLDVAVIAMTGRFPGAHSIDRFWDNLIHGIESIVPLSDQDILQAGSSHKRMMDPNFVKAGAYIENPELFDAKFFGITPHEAKTMDPQHRLFLECCHEVLEKAGYDPDSYDGAIGVFTGVCASTYLWNNLKLDPASIETSQGLSVIMSNERDYLATKVAYKLNLKGPSFTVQTACSTSLVSVHLACQSLLNGESDMALAGGVSMRFPQKAGYLYEEGGIVSPDGHCRAFDERAKGTVFGSGVGVVVLKRLSDAVRDGDDIQAVIKGSAINNDGSQKIGYTAPSIEGQTRVVEEALSMADINPETIGYVEAHGTGTVMGDPIEIEALSRAFRRWTDKTEFCGIGSVKTNVGHLDIASGVTGLIKAVLCLKNRLIPATLHFEKPNPKINFAASPFKVISELTSWAESRTPRRASVSSFGVGGTNAHVILEEMTASYATPPISGDHLLVLSAQTPAALAKMAHNLANHLEKSDLELEDVSYTLLSGRKSYRHRRIVVAARKQEAVDGLRKDPESAFASSRTSASDRPVAFLFSGQGSQYVNMGFGLAASDPIFRKHFDEVFERLKHGENLDLKREMGSKTIHQTAFTQPALFAVEYALANTLIDKGILPKCLIGHSLGEYTAACVAGIMSLNDALHAIAARGRLMNAMRPGQMTSVSLSEKRVRAYLSDHICLAVVNGPNQCVVAGPVDELEAAEAHLSSDGVLHRRILTSHAFHSHMMEPMLDEFRVVMSRVTLREPRIPVISNLTGTWLTASEALDPGYWVSHLRQTVRFYDGLKTLYGQPGITALEVGPGRVLTTLARMCPDTKEDQLTISCLSQDPDLEGRLFTEAVGKLWLSGIKLNPALIHKTGRKLRVSLPTYPYEKERHWVDSASHAPAKENFSATGHPLLGDQSRENSPDLHFRSEIDLGSLSYLRDHKIRDLSIFPATAYVEIAFQAGKRILGDKPFLVKACVIKEALILNEDNPAVVHTLVKAVSGDRREFEVRVCSETSSEKGIVWIHHFSAILGLGKHPSERVNDAINAASAKTRFPEEISVQEFYRYMSGRGISWGRGFQGIRHLTSGKDEALADVNLPFAPSSQDHAHPALLDACLQAMSAAFSRESVKLMENAVYLPVSIERIEIDRPLPARLFSHAKLKPMKADDLFLEGDFDLLDSDFVLIGSIRGLKLKREGVSRKSDNELPGIYSLSWNADETSLLRTETTPWTPLDSNIPEQIKDAVGGFAQSNPDLRPSFVYARPAEEEETGDPASAAEKYCRDLLLIAQTLAATSFKIPPRLAVVTRGSQMIGNCPVRPGQAPVWGLAGVIAAEYPEWECRRVDLDEQPADFLFEYLASGDREMSVAFRDRRRLIPRLVETTRDNGPRLIPSGHYGLAIRGTGSFDRLETVSISPERVGPGQVKIEVHAAGLNFKDILICMGQFPVPIDGPYFMGSECSGKVLEVGEGVEHVRPGDDVIAISPGAMSRSAVTYAPFVVKKPVGMSFEEAATVPNSFLTAYYALCVIGKIAPGEKVLIHSAAGALGMAAIQICRDLDAEVWATVGNDEKRLHLEAMGIPSHRILNSRHADFGEEILQRTGGAGVDAVLNSLSGEAIANGLKILKPFGRFLDVSKTDMFLNKEIGLSHFLRGLTYAAIDLGLILQNQPLLIREMLEQVMSRFEKGRYQPLPLKTYDFKEASRAFLYMTQRKNIGKVVLSLPSAQSADESHFIRPLGSYLITGGMGGLGLKCARWLAHQGAKNLILIGRGAPGQNASAEIESLRNQGVKVLVSQTDVSDQTALKTLLSRIDETMPPLKGILHTAGVLEDGILANLTWSRFQDVMLPKTRGTWNLHEATLDQKIDFFVLFSSTASVFSSAGQGNYVAANSFMDALAHHRHGLGLPASTINWGPWAEVGMAARTPGLTLPTISPSEGLTILETILREKTTQAVILPLPSDLHALPATALTHPLFRDLVQKDETSSLGRAALDSQEGNAVFTLQEAERFIAGIFKDVLGIESIRKNDHFFDLGGSSLTSLQVMSQLKKKFQGTLSDVSLYQAPTPESLARLLFPAAETDNEVLDDLESRASKRKTRKRGVQ